MMQFLMVLGMVSKNETARHMSELQYTFYLYKQLGSATQRCLYFQGFRGSKSLRGCLVVV